ncbi:hypothetical protein E2C01_064069 [Portunus trituberculatus]|uniref:Uncharacterized protein n=1 Tax=Portunus trituberculatus TaxID=210409 RepID=A0A5B7HMA1_PORTR|nr:hypothetical protein [Portunus trituberculatus]
MAPPRAAHTTPWPRKVPAGRTSTRRVAASHTCRMGKVIVAAPPWGSHSPAACQACEGGGRPGQSEASRSATVPSVPGHTRRSATCP